MSVAVLVFGTPAVVISLIIVMAGTAVIQSLAFPSGIFVGLGITWLLLALRATLACDALNQSSTSGCVAPDLSGLVVVAVLAIGLGLLIGIGALWRRSSGVRHDGD